MTDADEIDAINTALSVAAGLFRDEGLAVSFDYDAQRFILYATYPLSEEGMEEQISQKLSFFLHEKLSISSPDVSYSNVKFNQDTNHYDVDYRITLSREELQGLLDERQGGLKGKIVQDEARKRCESALKIHPIQDPISQTWTEIVEQDNGSDKGNGIA